MNTENQTEKILTVEDDESLLRLIQAILAREGFHCLTATSVEQASEILTSQEISLTLIDWSLRGAFDTSGVEVLRLCREIDSLMGVIVMSGVLLDVRTDAFVEKADGFLEKPFNVASLLHNVRHWTKRAKSTWKHLPPKCEEDILPLESCNGRGTG